ncbi:MAG TPA: hypothetical protein G4O04_01130 [Anaerolineae bacterium]|nr:hypothetical protein [Anaerolineae bacterium]HID85026.1 hypothetical protein [Anaerolineales bacterium]HIQ08178.1 hypothetical protein [Anaerolineaceae bacterium]
MSRSFTLRKPQTPADWAMAVFGVMALLLGAVGLISPEAVLRLLSLPAPSPTQRASVDLTRAFLTASSMASFNMGVYYLLAVGARFVPFYRWTVPFRMLTFLVFTLAVWRGVMPPAFFGVAVWELLGALVVAWTLRYEPETRTSG